MKTNTRKYNLFLDLYKNDVHFKQLVIQGFKDGKIRFFGYDEWDKIESQNFVSPTSEMKEFMDMFDLGYNVGNCVGASRQLSYSYDDVDIVSGILPIIKGSLNAEEEGGHCWLETATSIIDASLLLVIDISLKEEFGYVEEQRTTAYELSQAKIYQARKKYVNDKKIRARYN